MKKSKLKFTSKVIIGSTTFEGVAVAIPDLLVKFGLLGEAIARSAVTMTLFSIKLGEVRETFHIMRCASSKIQLQNRLASRVSKFSWQ